ncbi:tRNA-dihydrouridine synthase family protein [Parabacteroides bouchesdurhonensis]|uniref:tRNA-dihydrouridine synthase family protein n=1 Tax=Parabacteroides bouchesdurhonensis TaxID=1936995 RepID=UPI000E51A90C|nr:tRNA-dihydrouridine synthase family protein [Parabacteroides bouchesdurhonensis]RHJ90491.1 tRNA-dihydrouridine synthase family protein [Bacteroides sp. AM07-16]
MEYEIHFAPLQGYTDTVYRETHARVFGGVETYYTPFVRLEKGAFRNKELRDIAVSDFSLSKVVPQLIASVPEEFRTIATLFYEKGYRRADINWGCPFPMQVRQHRGAGILPFKKEVTTLLDVISEFPDMRFSIKLRLGWERVDDAIELIPLLNQLPLEHITLHPRLGIRQYKGKVDMDGFTAFYHLCKHPLFYNGDIENKEDIQTLLTRFPLLKGVMVGRGLLAHPWLAAEYIEGKNFTDIEKKDKLMTFHSLLLEGYQSRLEGGGHQILDKLKTCWDYLLPEADKKLRKKVIKSNNLASYTQAVTNLFQAYPFI